MARRARATPDDSAQVPGAGGLTLVYGVFALSHDLIWDLCAAANAAGGGGSTSGQMTLKRNTTLLQLLAQLGNLSDIDLKSAYLMRTGKTLDVNFEKMIMNGDVSQDVKLEANDVIYLPAGFTCRIRLLLVSATYRVASGPIVAM